MADPQPGDGTASQIHFNKDDYTKLINTINADRDDIDTRFLTPAGGLRLDDTLGIMVKPGATNWPPVQKIQDKAKSLGSSVNKEFGGLSDKWLAFTNSLRDASDVFQQNSDLANMSAQDFLDKYPGLNPGG